MNRAHCHLLFWALLLCGWPGYMLAGEGVALATGEKYGGGMNWSGQGLFTDPARFMQNRALEGLWLVVLLLVWASLHRWLASRLTPRVNLRWRWAVHGGVGFVLLNVWVGCASNTALYWMALGAGAGEEPYRQFQFKRRLASEVQGRERIVLVGSSQTHAQINARLLNDRLGTNAWSTDLHYPGCKAHDLLLMEPQLTRTHPQWVVYYLTESALYLNANGGLASQFLTLDQLPEAARRGAVQHIHRSELAFGVLGSVLPLFRCRDALGHRFLGSPLMELQRRQLDPAQIADLEGRALRRARQFRVNAASDFQKRALEEFVTRCTRAGCRVLVLTGANSPVLTEKIAPAVHEDLRQYLDGLAARHPQVTVVPASALPVQTASDYFSLDLVHANHAMQRRFTLHLAELLEDLLRQPTGR
ncbi:MAG: hypothetical protein EBS05_23505 [Proteobacteria bacterium]|nr:hypothetical protein [Pseudomonadota bacterium]